MQSGEGHCSIYSMQSCELYRSAAQYNAICNLVKGIAAYKVCNLVKYIEVQHTIKRYAIW
jgi:hypothetical protein